MFNFDRKDVYSWANCEEAQKYIGQEGYFGDSLESLEARIQRQNLLKLGRIDASDAICFHTLERDELDFDTGSDECLFLPADKVKEVKKEKKYRPFSLEEFLSKFSIGTKISFRRRDMTGSIYGLFEGYQTDKDETEAYHKIIICNLRYTLNDLFEKYEYLDEHGEWQPFGVEEKSKV